MEDTFHYHRGYFNLPEDESLVAHDLLDDALDAADLLVRKIEEHRYGLLVLLNQTRLPPIRTVASFFGCDVDAPDGIEGSFGLLEYKTFLEDGLHMNLKWKLIDQYNRFIDSGKSYISWEIDKKALQKKYG